MFPPKNRISILFIEVNNLFHSDATSQRSPHYRASRGTGHQIKHIIKGNSYLSSNKFKNVAWKIPFIPPPDKANMLNVF